MTESKLDIANRKINNLKNELFELKKKLQKKKIEYLYVCNYIHIIAVKTNYSINASKLIKYGLRF